MTNLGQGTGSNIIRIPQLTRGLDDALDVRFYFDVPSDLRAEIRRELEKLQNMTLLGEGYSRREIHVYPHQPRYYVIDKIDDQLYGTYSTGSRRLTSEEVITL